MPSRKISPRFPSRELDPTDHRPWPLPRKPWLMRQQWWNLLFLHYPVDPAQIRGRIPAALELDLFDGQAWLGVVPFDMKRVTGRGCPAPKSLCDFPEINVRTYVIHDGKPGVWFFSLDVPGALAVWAARTFFHLPYFKAEVTCSSVRERVRYGYNRGNRKFYADYYPVGEVFYPEDGFAHWATARYALYCQSRQSAVYRGDIHHAPWPLQRAEVEMKENSILSEFDAGGLHPSVLFSRSLEVVVYPLEKI
ncbi:DUF2071 domain-containing protein [Kiritimatiellaeota bacterium B1221]|nr:DUF2071 domain-containing protein [Kiritimatiellaeota bacterium B1221]